MKRSLLLALFFLVSCATRTPVTDNLTRKANIPSSSQIQRVPLIKQDEKQCGPASLAMVLQYYGVRKTPEHLAQDLFHKDLGGSFRSDVLASARREGMMAIETDDLADVLEEVSSGNPVLVFQNLGLSYLPQWHFSVITGYDLGGPDVILNSGEDEQQKMDMRVFERSWILGGKWGAIILPPDRLARTASEVDHLESASLLEKIGKIEEAQRAYSAILERWPESYLALIGRANTAYALKDKPLAERFFRKAVQVNPRSSIGWHNLALVQDELGRGSEAKISARKALEVVEKENAQAFKVSLRRFLD